MEEHVQFHERDERDVKVDFRNTVGPTCWERTDRTFGGFIRIFYETSMFFSFQKLNLAKIHI
jgi:hypothetical protein